MKGDLFRNEKKKQNKKTPAFELTYSLVYKVYLESLGCMILDGNEPSL